MYDVGGDLNPRALFGGGRYDDLLEIFGKEKLPAFGLGWGSITMMDFMETYNLFPKYKTYTQVFVTLPDERSLTLSSEITKKLRDGGVKVEQQIAPTDLRKQLTYASKRGYPWVVILSDKRLVLKDLSTGKEFYTTLEEVLKEYLRNEFDIKALNR
jgi:histidyl-tRNA synthetase